MSWWDEVSADLDMDTLKVKKEMQKIAVRTVVAASITGNKALSQMGTSSKISDQRGMVQAALYESVMDVNEVMSGKAAKKIVEKASDLAGNVPDFNMGTNF